jgi:hypothetical protein
VNPSSSCSFVAFVIMNLSLRDILAGRVGQRLSKPKYIREYVLDAN